MSKYVNPNVRSNQGDMSFEGFRKAFPELAEPALKAEREAGRKAGHAEGFSAGLAAGKAAAVKEIQAQKAKQPTPEELAKIEEALPLEERAKRRWLRDPELRGQYKLSGYAGYLATLKHEAKSARKR